MLYQDRRDGRPLSRIAVDDDAAASGWVALEGFGRRHWPISTRRSAGSKRALTIGRSVNFSG